MAVQTRHHDQAALQAGSCEQKAIHAPVVHAAPAYHAPVIHAAPAYHAPAVAPAALSCNISPHLKSIVTCHGERQV